MMYTEYGGNTSTRSNNSIRTPSINRLCKCTSELNVLGVETPFFVHVQDDELMCGGGIKKGTKRAR